ncbi:hypothetical protein M8818_000245 [Zalaria obscura]|uniref:Uncharacterized protein n=1 Tax=Zalaria obscura TaxID=2024903 RepID=A0ACC3SS86_9PEZI
MPFQITPPNRHIPVESLTHASFSSFGTVIQNPAHAPTEAPKNIQAVPANQGSAVKYVDVSYLTNDYHVAPSRKPARAVMNMFVSSPRSLKASSSTSEKTVFPVQILERHPYTPQTFIPMGLAGDDSSTSYLVIVAPTLPASSRTAEGKTRPKPYPAEAPKRGRSIRDIFTRARPTPFTNTHEPPARQASHHQTGAMKPKGSGLPDLTQLRAFIANGSQAVTYGPGTWHAPMVVLGAKSVDFVVVQYANDVGREDCQEVELQPEQGAEGLLVVIEKDSAGKLTTRANARL